MRPIPLLARLARTALLACAVALAAGCTHPQSTAAPVEAVALDPPSTPEWERDMARFAAEDAATPPPANAYVFTGSSSVRLWATLAADFPGKPVLNRGFGGSQVRDAVHYADQLAVRYKPRMILLYAGDNDINAGRTPQQVASDVRAFIARIRRDLPDTPIAYLSIKPSPARAEQLPRQREANALIRAETKRWKHVKYIDIATPMLDANGQPRPELSGPDRLHMNRAGYQLWRDVVAPYLR